MMNTLQIKSARARLNTIGFLIAFLLFGFVGQLKAQYTTAIGMPTFTTALPVEMGFTNVANGNLHIEIPLASFPQRGTLGYNARLVYDSLIWKIAGTTWQPANVPSSMGGWRLVTGGETGTVSYSARSNPCDTQPPIKYRTIYGPFTWTAPDGTSHLFPIQTMRDTTPCKEGYASASGLANDSSGYRMRISNYTSATVFAPDGTQLYPNVMDTNGNYFSTDGSGNIIDTLGRTPITATTNGNTITYAVLNPQGTRTNITVTTTTVSASTSFGKSGVTECQSNCTVTAIQSIAFDDGTNYAFTYDAGFAELTGMKLRTGANISYGYTTFADGLGNYSRWLSSKSDGTNTWSFTPVAQGQTAQQVNVGEPSGESISYSFTLNNGAWQTGATYVDSSQTARLYLTNTWDTSQGCGYYGCTGSGYIRQLTATTQFPNGPAKTVSYYSSVKTGQVSEIDESDYSTGTPSILRKTLFSYASLTNTVSKPSQVTIKDGSNNILSQVNYTYDESQYLTATSGIAQHGTPSSSRGNGTTVSRWVSGSNYLASHTNFYDTGVPYQTIDPNSATTQYSYACQGAYVNSIAAPLGITSSFSYDCNTGLLGTATDPNNQATSCVYDSEGRATEIDYPDGGQKSITYNLSSTTPNIVTTTKIDSSQNFVTTALLDGLGRIIQTQVNSDPAGTDKVDTTYDSMGRVNSVSNPYRSSTNGTTSYAYDVLGRTAQITRPDNQIIQFKFGDAVSQAGGRSSQISTAYGLGYPSLQIDEAGRMRQQWTDALGRIIEVDEPDPSSGSLTSGSYAGTFYAYDVLDNKTNIYQAAQTRSFTYDALSRKTSETSPEEGAANSAGGTTYFYYTTSGGTLCADDPSAVCRSTDARGITATFTYDSLGRNTQKDFSNGDSTITYAYDQSNCLGLSSCYNTSHPTSMSDGSGSTYWAYDKLGRILREQHTVGSITKSISYAYNLAGQVASTTYPSGNTVSFNYNNAGQPVDAIDSTSGINYALNGSYFPNGALASVVLGQAYPGFAGITSTYGLNNRMKISSISASSSNGSVLDLSYSYGSSNNGNVARVANNLVSDRSQNFTYDYLNRVLSAYSDANSGNDTWGQAFGYDAPYGNLTSITVTKGSAPSLSQSIDGYNKNRISGFSYDNAGNVTSDSSYSYSWNAQNQLTSAAGVNYTYDGKGLRVSKSNGTLYWYGSGGAILSETDLSGNGQREYVYFDGARIARRDTNGSVYYFFSDHLGTARVMTNNLGIIQQESTYTPFGVEQRSINNTVDNRHRFTGLERDSETGLDHTQYRQYSSIKARWLSPDPICSNCYNPQTLNRYSYVNNNPVNYIDPWGLFLSGWSNDDYAIYITVFGSGFYGGGGGGGGIRLPQRLLPLDQGPYGQMPTHITKPTTQQAANNDAPLWCQSDVIEAMNRAWSNSGNAGMAHPGTQPIEAGFNVNGTPSSYDIAQSFTNQ